MPAQVSRLITDAMLKEAAEAITRNSAHLTAEVSTHLGWPCLDISLNDPPHTQIVAHVRDRD